LGSGVRDVSVNARVVDTATFTARDRREVIVVKIHTTPRE